MKEYYNVNDERLYYDVFDDFEEDGGIYTLHCRYSKDSTEFKPIKRILDTDKNGILYIGESETLVTRLIDLKKSILPKYKTYSHDVGKYYFIIDTLRNEFPIDLLVLKLVKSDNPKAKEKELLKIYTHKFGELPPFNSKSEFMTDLIDKINNES